MTTKYIIQHNSYALHHPKIIGVTSSLIIAEDWIFNKLREEDVAFLISKNESQNQCSYGEHRYSFTITKCEEDILS